MLNFLKITTLLLCFIYFNPISAQVRHKITLKDNWEFSRDQQHWEKVCIPHDWAIYGPFNSKNDEQNVAIAQDGQQNATEHAGRTGGLPFVGMGWYRTSLELPQFTKGKKASIIFDGAMSEAQVYINGEKVGFWPYGYNSFHFDITSFLKEGEKNSISVRLENKAESSRWYPGAGLYRNVHIIITEEAHIPVWGTYITTPIVEKDSAKVIIRTKVNLPKGEGTYSLINTIFDKYGMEVAQSTGKIYKNNEVKQTLWIKDPSLWSPDSPELYSAESRLYEGDVLKDIYTTSFGIRSISVIPNEGFFLNGEKIKFKGVCNHHDLGPLGAAVNDAAIRRQIRLLKNMGCNAIRTSHNMPSHELVRACDQMGMMLMAESFDEWNVAKCKNGYNRFFNEWAEKDLVNLVQHYRNNPSVVMWCIGNEVPNQWHSNGYEIAKMLQDICHREDPSRPVTQGMDVPQEVVNNNFAAVMDIPGFNYRPHLYVKNYDKLPQRLILGSETASTVSSRGVYKFPVKRKSMTVYPDHQSSSYDVEHCSWSNLPEDDFIQHEDLPYCMGEFVWTGFDYLGEPTPYYTNWPSHSSLFGIIDLAGIPKDRYYLYRSLWNKEVKTLHILPHWTWPGREGETTPIFVYTNYPSAELFINGKSQGKRFKNTEITIDESTSAQAQLKL